MATQRRSAALFDGRHHLELAQAQMAVLFLTPVLPMVAENIRDLQGGACHGPIRAAIPPTD
jgi:hypothetical protein